MMVKGDSVILIVPKLGEAAVVRETTVSWVGRKFMTVEGHLSKFAISNGIEHEWSNYPAKIMSPADFEAKRKLDDAEAFLVGIGVKVERSCKSRDEVVMKIYNTLAGIQ